MFFQSPQLPDLSPCGFFSEKCPQKTSCWVSREHPNEFNRHAEDWGPTLNGLTLMFGKNKL